MEDVQVTSVCDVNREGPGYISWNWMQGTEQELGGREPARTAERGPQNLSIGPLANRYISTTSRGDL
jgi:hypothetical protein